jgi:hypothetical protein
MSKDELFGIVNVLLLGIVVFSSRVTLPYTVPLLPIKSMPFMPST